MASASSGLAVHSRIFFAQYILQAKRTTYLQRAIQEKGGSSYAIHCSIQIILSLSFPYKLLCRKGKNTLYLMKPCIFPWWTISNCEAFQSCKKRQCGGIIVRTRKHSHARKTTPDITWTRREPYKLMQENKKNSPWFVLKKESMTPLKLFGVQGFGAYFVMSLPFLQLLPPTDQTKLCESVLDWLRKPFVSDFESTNRMCRRTYV